MVDAVVGLERFSSLFLRMFFFFPTKQVSLRLKKTGVCLSVLLSFSLYLSTQP